MVKFAIGQGVTRVEDNRLLTGTGRYTEDIEVEGAVRSAILRSPFAHARIKSVDTADAKAAPGVIAVYTGADVEAELEERVFSRDCEYTHWTDQVCGCLTS